jgi:uncharacterized protein (DUF2267 family)
LNTKPLEEAVMRGVRQALTEDVAEHALKVALRELQRRMDAANPEAVEAELADLDRKIERALDLAIEGSRGTRSFPKTNLPPWDANPQGGKPQW